MDHLALQVAIVNGIGVDDAHRPDAGGGQVERRGRAETAGADQEDLGVEELLLPCLTNLRNEQVAGVAPALIGRQRLRHRPGQPCTLPGVEAALDRDDVAIAEVLEGLGGESGAGPAGAVDGDRAGAIGDGVLDAELEESAGDVDRARDRALIDLILLADVKRDRAVGDHVLGFVDVDFADAGLGLREQIGRGHWGHRGWLQTAAAPGIQGRTPIAE